MNNQVTDLETSKKLQEIMRGVETEKVWETYLDYKVGTDGKPKPVWREWKLAKYSKGATSSNLYKYVPAYTLQATAQLLLWCCEQGHLQEGGDEL